MRKMPFDLLEGAFGITELGVSQFGVNTKNIDSQFEVHIEEISFVQLDISYENIFFLEGIPYSCLPIVLLSHPNCSDPQWE